LLLPSQPPSLLLQVHGLFAKAAVNGVTELLPLIADQLGLPEGTRQLLELLHSAATQLMAGVPAGGLCEVCAVITSL
jgi:hypothetical protein